MIKEKDLVFILSSSAIVAFIWIASTLYHAYVTSTIEEPLTTFIQPISARFNTQTIQKITNRAETTPTYDLTGVTRLPSPTLSEAPSTFVEEPSSLPTEPASTEPTPTEPIIDEEGDEL